MENFIFPEEHQYRDAERTGFGCRDGQPDALDAQNHGQEDEGQQLEQQSAQEGDERTGHAVAQRSEEGRAIDIEAHEEEVQGVDAEGVAGQCQQLGVVAHKDAGHADKGLLEEPLFTRLAAKYGKSNVQIILRWHIQAGNVVIPGSKNPAHIHDNFDVFDFALTDAEMQEITTLNKDKRYYEVTEDKLAAFATMFPPVEDQK